MATQLPTLDSGTEAFIRTKATAVVSSALLNFRRIHEIPYAVDSAEQPYAGRTVFVVGAGPSLAHNGEFLREAADAGAPIICVNASGCGVEGREGNGILSGIGVTPDVMVVRESLDLSDQVARTDARCVVLDISAHPNTWAACQEHSLNARWYVPLYPRHAIIARRLGVPAVAGGTAALTAAVALAIEWGAAEVVLAGVDLAFDGELPYHPSAPRGEERVEPLGPAAVRFRHREQDRERCERSGQVMGPDELGVTRCIAADFSGYLRTLSTWEVQRTWLQECSQRHTWLRFTNATERGGGVVGWAQETLRAVTDRLERHAGPPPLPQGVPIHPSVAEQNVEGLRREAAVLDAVCRELLGRSGPDLEHLPLMGLEQREGHQPRFGLLEFPLLTPILGSAALLGENLFATPPKTPERLRRVYELTAEAARAAAGLLK